MSNIIRGPLDRRSYYPTATSQVNKPTTISTCDGCILAIIMHSYVLKSIRTYEAAFISFLSPPTGSLCGTISGDPIYRTISCCSLKERKTFRGKELRRRRKKNNKTTRFSLKGDRNVLTNCPFQHSLQQTTIHIHVFLNINFVTAALLRDEACECYTSSHLFIPAAVGFIFLFGINPKSQKTI